MKIKNLFYIQVKTIFILCIIFVLFSGIQVKAQESEIEKLIKEVSTDSQKGAIFSYSYLMKFSYQQHKVGGRKFTRLYEAIIPSHFSLGRTYSHPFILLEDSDRRISDKEIKFSRQSIVKEIEKAETEEEKKLTDAEKLYEDGGYWTIRFSTPLQQIKVDVLRLLKNSHLSNLQRKQIDGTNVVSIEFSPNPDAVFDKSLIYLSKIAGQIWIDESAKRIIRIEGFAPGTFAKQKEKPDSERQKEAVFLFLQTKVTEGYWFPQTVWVNFANHPEIFEPVELKVIFTNYKKSSVDIQFQENKSKKDDSTSDGQ